MRRDGVRRIGAAALVCGLGAAAVARMARWNGHPAPYHLEVVFLLVGFAGVGLWVAGALRRRDDSDYYEILGVPFGADPTSIEAAFQVHMIECEAAPRSQATATSRSASNDTGRCAASHGGKNVRICSRMLAICCSKPA